MATSTLKIVLKRCAIKSIETITNAPTMKRREDSQSQSSPQTETKTIVISPNETSNQYTEHTEMAGVAAERTTSNNNLTPSAQQTPQQPTTITQMETTSERHPRRKKTTQA